MSLESVVVHLVGDSIVTGKEACECLETGWGVPFTNRFDSAVMVADHVRGDRSTRTFLEEGHWCPVAHQLTETDYVFAQFDHNDEVPSKKQLSLIRVSEPTRLDQT